MKGCMGFILDVDLSSGKIEKKRVDEAVYENLLAGKGLGAWYLLNNIPAGADPMGKDNILGFVSGSLTGTGAPICGRWSVVTKSPLTGGWGDANCGGNFSPAIKRCGVDGIFFRGISGQPVYLYMTDEACELRDAGAYWGMDAAEAEKKLISDHAEGRKPSVAVIGTSGEKRSLISGICNEGGRIAARSGVGAVMGGKNLKALVLSGNVNIECHNKKRMTEYAKELAVKIKKAHPGKASAGALYGVLGRVFGALPVSLPLDGAMNVGPLSKWGSSVNTVMGVNNGDAPIKNWGGVPRDTKNTAKVFNPDRLHEREIKKYHCYSCTLGCGSVVNIKDLYGGEYEHTHKPEYETVAVFGPLLLNNNLEAILYINELLNRAGMDSISAGNTIAYAVECYENGLISKEQTGGLELKWGNHEDIVRLVKMMIAREGLGDILADGVKKAAERLGPKTAAYAMHIGGQEPGMHDPRYDPQVGLHYVTEPAPGKHTIGSGTMYSNMSLWDISAWAPPVKPHPKKADRVPNEDMGLASRAIACYSMLADGAGGCMYAEIMGVNMWKLVEYLNTATGSNKTGDEYLEIGRRIQTLRHLFNVKHGIKPADRHLPERMEGKPPLPAGPLKGVSLRIDEQAKYHWKAMGYDPETGVPSEETVSALNIPAVLECRAVPEAG